ncbi:methyl-accepting chemotaxis protein [Moraxella bovis]|uniref:Methyl-accepting chemotaxis protein n=1 Tax=Moraxella bovis TaxID=476 RepID=A0AAQ2T2C1_MORBO|nr:methyl-accepting chemotaxis protein [Moraxella bovis]UYZ75520.1 methyl-accepting chemotaxis protein [Moraxella bovis]UYZ78538.1 methyl-accepting chemotaxis protein [Moraxella bovis]UYZ81424.1 methyl-accepting chemotaxis protein [Moraxella bovis]UYZ87020.1 methyl-accepting chemotaxis protein [Moraxella bovis]UYZ89284.1 methyl-accepting chemotaxis protein [Moraxella bovis]
MNDVSKVSEPLVVAPTSDSEKKWWMLLIISGFIAMFSLAYLGYSLLKVTDYLGDVNQLEVSAVNIVKDVNDATFSRDFDVSKAAYAKLLTDVQSYELALSRLQNNKMVGDAEAINAISSDWQSKKGSVDYIVTHQNDVNALQDLQNQVQDAARQMQEQYASVTDQAIKVGLSSATIKEIQEQILRLERISEKMAALTSSTGTNTDEFKEEVSNFARILKNQQAVYGQASPSLQAIDDTYQQMVKPVISQLTDLSNPTIQSRESAQALTDLATKTQEQLSKIDRGIITQKSILIPALLLLLSALALAFALYRLLRQQNSQELRISEKENMRQRQEMEKEAARARQIQEENERSQMAILRLLDELGDLAEGDLTVNATVSEDFTGAIADSVNFAIDQLRQLVLAINTTADRVAQSSQQTQMTAVELAEASEHQAQEIAGVSAAINEMAVSIDQVSANASESASVAQRSVAIAQNGADVVQRSIEGMNTIRNQIQETSKRIKRLGESSQEIGDIVGLINDIADQTNILALNAAIQASMAGEAGRGFAVVADEVQRLAERSAAATRQIETLVKTIQADTNEAVSSMESTTAEVVKGAKLAKDAGEALDEVQTVSNTLADLIQNISNAARQQATSAGHISSTMNIIQDITSQTSSGTMATARSVGRLNEMAAALQESVSGFKLSNDDVFADN